jgi:hypothetical protein
MNTVFGAGTLLLVALWSHRLFGRAGLVTSLVFAAFCPTLLAHGALATSDMAATFFLLAAVSAYGWHLRSAHAGIYALSVTAFALAVVAKYTAVLLPPMMALLALAHLIHARHHSTPTAGCQTDPRLSARLRVLAISATAHVGAAWLSIWAFFGFRFSTFHPDLPPGRYTLSWDYLLQEGGVVRTVVGWLRDLQALPEAFLYGFAFVVKHAETRGAFLDGAYSIYGWVEFFPKTLLYKSPPALLLAAMLTAGLIALHARRRDRPALGETLYRVAPLMVLFAVYWAASLTSNLNIGHRHLLPTYPVLFIACGALGWAAVRWPGRRGWAVTALVCLGMWQAIEALRIHPHQLAYFSPLAGGPTRGHLRLVDSSLDWGQDLPGLASWLGQHRRPGETVYQAYFGTADPEFHGVDAVMLPTLLDLRPRHDWYEPGPGLYAISVTMLQHVYSPIRGEWTLAWEKEYQDLRGLAPHFREALAAGDDPAWDQAWQRYDLLRFARLCHYLRRRVPEATIGHSIHVYRLDEEEITDVLHGPMSRWVEALARASATPRPWPQVYP